MFRSQNPGQISQDARRGLIVNPLKRIDGIALTLNVQRFYKNRGLENALDLKLLKRGALLAQDPANLTRWVRQEENNLNTHAEVPTGEEYDSHINGTTSGNAPETAILLSPQEKMLTPEETNALNRERDGTIRILTKDLVVVLATCAVAAIVQGWSQESIVGANLYWPVDLNIANRSKEGTMIWNYFDDSTPYKPDKGLKYFGLVNAMPYFAASVLGAWVSDPITYRYGRRTALFFAAICSLSGPIGGAYSRTWIQLLMCRLIQGVGIGAKASVVPVMESEVSPPKLRGRLLVSWQTFVALGIFLGASTNCIFNGQWRHQIGIAFVPAIPLLCLCYVIPESPRWLMRKGLYKEAYLVFVKLRETPLQAARDFYLIYAQLQLETLLSSGKDITDEDLADHLENHAKSASEDPASLRKFFSRVPELITYGRNRRAVVGACVVMIAQQFSGINIFAFLATTLFNDASIGPMKNLWVTFGFAASNAVFSPVAYFLIDWLGRRTLLLTSLIAMLPFLLLTGHYLDAPQSGSPDLKAVVPLVIIYAALYSPGAGVIPFMYSSEVFSQVYREVGMSLACAVNFSFAGALAMAVPQYADNLSKRHFKLLGAFAGLDGFAAILVWLFMRSPQQAVELEDMNFLFHPPLTDYIWYQISHVTVRPFTQILRTWGGPPPKPKLTFDKWEEERRKQGHGNREEEGTSQMDFGQRNQDIPMNSTV